MKTFQIDIEESLFPELKRVLNLFPKNSVMLYKHNGYEIQLDSDEVELTDELKAFLDEGIAELDNGKGIPHEQVVAEMQAKYPNLINILSHTFKSKS
ncbi:MAG: hypothetical protein Q8R96_17855 [Bacteroidota bacterium]|nr:hypothetical protein [Bacteroidota bacterium]